jgi:hypothetical protein
MFHWKIIILLLIIKILSFIISHYYTNNHVQKIFNEHNEQIYLENKQMKLNCITPTIRDFMFCWIKFTIEMIEYSKAIIKNYKNSNTYYNNLEKTKNELIKLFFLIHKDYGEKFQELINKQMFYKINFISKK